MKKQGKETNVKVTFKDNTSSMNKLVTFIINKILEDYDKLGGIVNGDEKFGEGGYSESVSK